MNYKTIKKDGICEEEIKKSRFICQLKRVETEEEGREYIAQVKKEHYKEYIREHSFTYYLRNETRQSNSNGLQRG